MNKVNRKKEWLHLLLAVLVMALVWAYKDFVATALSVLFSVVVVLWAIAMWQAIAKGISVKEVSLEETFKGWWTKLKAWFVDLRKPAKKVEGPVEEYDDAEEETDEHETAEAQETEEEEPQTEPEKAEDDENASHPYFAN